jgi:ABC-type antimicrobial peptide transport system permease subunit
MAAVYGVIAYSVAQRSSEIGLRMALGASRGWVLWLVLRQGLVVTGVGLAAAAAGTRWLTTVLFEVQVHMFNNRTIARRICFIYDHQTVEGRDTVISQ